MTYRCKNCYWQGDEPIMPLKHCPVCGDNTEMLVNITKKEEPIIEKPKLDFDVNNDGKVDKEDYKEMGKALGKRGGSKPKKR